MTSLPNPLLPPHQGLRRARTGDCGQFMLFVLLLPLKWDNPAPAWDPFYRRQSPTHRHRSPPHDAVLQAQAAPAQVPHRVTSPGTKSAPARAPLSKGPQVLPGPCSSVAFSWSHSLLWTTTCSGVGSCIGCR